MRYITALEWRYRIFEVQQLSAPGKRPEPPSGENGINSHLHLSSADLLARMPWVSEAIVDQYKNTMKITYSKTVNRCDKQLAKSVTFVLMENEMFRFRGDTIEKREMVDILVGVQEDNSFSVEHFLNLSLSSFSTSQHPPESSCNTHQPISASKASFPSLC